MDKKVDTRFERIEKALTNLIDSVAKYNPSSFQARDLDVADQELSQGLEEVQEHQRNYQRILRLRQESQSLDNQIRETLTSLSTTRQDVKTTHTTIFSDAPRYQFSYAELLGFARRISKTTLPPPGISNSLDQTQSLLPSQGQTQMQVDSQGTGAGAGSSMGGGGGDAPMMNGGTQTQTQTPVGTQPPTPMSQIPGEFPTQTTATSINTSLPEGLTVHLNPLSGQIFVPWPTEEKVRVGALAGNQILAEQGIDPKGYDPVEEEEKKKREEEERKAAEERERIAREENERKLREERERARVEREKARESNQEAWRRGSLVGPPTSATAGPGENVKKQFQFTSIDDMDDDD